MTKEILENFSLRWSFSFIGMWHYVSYKETNYWINEISFNVEIIGYCLKLLISIESIFKE